MIQMPTAKELNTSEISENYCERIPYEIMGSILSGLEYDETMTRWTSHRTKDAEEYSRIKDTVMKFEEELYQLGYSCELDESKKTCKTGSVYCLSLDINWE